MDPRMASGIAARHLSEYFEELERDRELRRRTGRRKMPKRRLSFLRFRRARPKAHAACPEPAATETC